MHLICICYLESLLPPCVFPAFFIFFFSKIIHPNTVAVFSVFWQVIKSAVWGICVRVFGALYICIWFVWSLGSVLPPPLCSSLFFSPWFLHFQQNWFSCCLFLCFGRWLNVWFGVFLCSIFLFSCFYILTYPPVSVWTHIYPSLIGLAPSFPSTIPCIISREFPDHTHTQNMNICTHPHPQVPFLIVSPLQHTPTHPTHPYTSISNRNYIHIHHMKNMYKLMILKPKW